jgi:hypothetical protein
MGEIATDYVEGILNSLSIIWQYLKRFGPDLEFVLFGKILMLEPGSLYW